MDQLASRANGQVLLKNCGGVPGYEHLLEVLRDPRHEEHRDLLNSVGEDFDPELFDAKAATWQMRKYN